VSPATKGRSDFIIAALAAGGIVAALMQTLVVPLIGELPRILNTSASNASWVITVTLLVGAVATPITGRLGDLYGKKRMLLVCVIPLFLGPLVCAASSSVVPMIIGRGLQGIGAGIIPLGISVMRDVLPAERLGSSIAVMSASLGIGGALGLPISAAVVEYTSWRIMFLGVAVLVALVGAGVWFLVPNSEPQGTGGFDPLGAVGIGVTLVCLLLAVSKGGDWGWTSTVTLGLFAVAAVALAFWLWWELRLDDPLIDLRLAARRPVLLTNAASVVIGFGMFAQSLILPQLLQLPTATGYGLGQSMLEMGLWMFPGGLVMMAVSPIGARISARYGPKITLVAGSLVIALGYGIAMILMGSTPGLLVVTCVSSAGVGLAYGAMPALIMSSVPLSETASANSFNTLMRSVGTTSSAAVIGVVLAQMTTQFAGHTIPTEAGFRTGLLLGCGVAVVAALVALGIPGRSKTPPPATQQVEETAPSRA